MEQEFIQWLKQHVLESSCAQNSLENVRIGIGDDGAVVSGSSSRQVLVTDAIVDGVHFRSSTHKLEDVGRKALTINLSDIAAMGAIAETALITVVLPLGMTIEEAKRLFTGIAETARQYQIAVVGGDTVRHDGALVINVAATGRIEPIAKSPDGWLIDGAQAGDVLVVTGPLGGSILGKHLSFEPRLELAAAIQSRVRVHAATDISDSLSIDLGQMVRSSGVGAKLDLDSIPITNAATVRATESGKTAVHHALTDGEDFELLLSMSPQACESLKSDEGFKFELFEIGVVTDSNIGQIVDFNTADPIEQIGYQH